MNIIARIRLKWDKRALADCSRFLSALGICLLLLAGGCSSPRYSEDAFKNLAKTEKLVLNPGDTVTISFAGAPNLNTTQQVRRDGVLALPLAGEVKAAGLQPVELEKELLKLYGPQLVTKQVTVTLQASVFPVFVTGAVLRPGKIMADRPLTALEAVMEAGGFDFTKANTKGVKVIRNVGGKVEHFTLNFKRVLSGQESEPFYLKPSDVLYVPEKFTWF